MVSRYKVKNIFAQEGCKSIEQQNLFSSFTIQYSKTKAKALAINFIHLNYNEITYHSPPCTLDLPYLYLEENNNFDSTNEENYATYQNPIAGCEILESLAYVIEKDTIAEINNSPFWSILLDESNTITNEKTLAIVSKHIANNIPLFCTAKELNLTRLIHFGSDGASNMTRLYNGLGTRLKYKNLFISANHCIAHCLYLLSWANVINNLYQILDNVKEAFNSHEIPTKPQALNNFKNDELIFLNNYYDKEIESKYGILAPKLDKTKLSE
ncbi:21391_t:CDS:2, partial [Gigaspora margarita]